MAESMFKHSEKIQPNNFFKRIIGVIFGNRIVTRDIIANKPYLGASLTMLAFLVINVLLTTLGTFNCVNFGVLGMDFIAFFLSIAFALFFIVFFLAVLWITYSMLAFGISKLSHDETNIGAAYCFSAYFYPLFTLFYGLYYLFSLVCSNSSLQVSWYLTMLSVLFIIFCILLLVCLYRFFRVSYSLGRVVSLLIVMTYPVGIYLLWFFVKLWINSLAGGAIYA